MALVTHELVPLGDKGRWQEALEHIPHAPAHTHDHVLAFQASSPDPHVLYVCRNGLGEVEAACPLAIREDSAPDVYTPYGFGGFASRRSLPWFAAEWGRFAEGRGWVTSYIAMNPLLDNDLGFPQAVTKHAQDLFILDLRPDLESIKRAMSRSRRAALARWDQAPSTITWEKSRVLDFVRQEAAAHFARRSAVSTYSFRDETWELLLASPTVMAVAVTQKNGLSACCIVGMTEGSADYLFGIPRPGGERHAAPLLWEAIKALRATGVQTLNLGGGIRADDGVGEFKRRFGARGVPMTTLQLVHDRERYARLSAESETVPEVGRTFFPSYRMKVR
ncbi:MAG TPA: hypothetical protein DEG43_16250 [Acidimicrobiaceae bacterium]|jgi:hypothetical protein|nr:hypothetical protein [Acidimicrobiaceae bacterium]